jgi:hypothetical protein
MVVPAAPSLRLARKRRLLERHWPWLLTFGCATLALSAFVLALDGGRIAGVEGLEPIVRGYTPVGVLLGLGAVLLSFVTFAYALRKRALQERPLLGRSTLATWLWAHVYLGLLALVVAFAHAGYGAITSTFSTGKLLLLLLALLVGSGVLWRLIYAVVPAAAAKSVGNYSAAASHARAEALSIEIEKLAAGSSPRFRELKGWVMPRTPAPHELAQALASLPPEEQPAFAELATLAATRLDALGRERRQASYVRWLQGLRIAHVPLGLLFVLLIPLHVLFAYDVPARTLEPKRVGGSALGGFEPSTTCASCHRDIYDAWRHSMHAHAMTSPIMIAQTNQVAARVLHAQPGPDPKEACVACHGPIGTLLTEGNTLPLPAQALSDRALLDDGISCAVCHQWQGQSHTGGAALARFQEGLEPGRKVFGPFGDAVGNAFHRSEKSELFTHPAELCRNCHSVQLDKNGDGRFDRGTDLVLQTLFDEWDAYAKAGGASCLDCHMWSVRRAKRAASGASIPFEQDQAAPARSLRDHAFVGVDYPLDDRAARDAIAEKRAALLASAGTLSVPPASVKKSANEVAFDATVANTGTGHYLPGGFAFVRQMWLEVTITDAAGKVLATSGHLSKAFDDLCDASIMDDPESPMRPLLTGCTAVDAELVNFQQMLVDRVEVARDEKGEIRTGLRGERLLARPVGAKEAVLQELAGGPVPRPRKATGKPTVPLAPGESATFPYRIALPAGSTPAHLTVRMLFRVASPYFLRALGRDQPPNETPRLESLVNELVVTEMAKVSAEL